MHGSVDASKIAMNSKSTEWRIMISLFSMKETIKLFRFGAFIRDFFADPANKNLSQR
jgi:hypothetical protein